MRTLKEIFLATEADTKAFAEKLAEGLRDTLSQHKVRIGLDGKRHRGKSTFAKHFIAALIGEEVQLEVFGMNTFDMGDIKIREHDNLSVLPPEYYVFKNPELKPYLDPDLDIVEHPYQLYGEKYDFILYFERAADPGARKINIVCDSEYEELISDIASDFAFP